MSLPAPPPLDLPAAANATDAARQVFDDPAFWWKHQTSQPDSPPWPLWADLRHALGHALGWCLDALAKLLPLHALGRWLRGLIERLGAAANGATSSDIHHWVIAAIVIGLVSLLVLSRHQLRRWFGQAARGEPIAESPSAIALRDAARLFARAAAALAQGESAEAVRFSFLGAITGLQDDGLLEPGLTRTNLEQARELARSPKAHAGFAELIPPFERTCYGQLPISRGEAEHFLARCRALVDPDLKQAA